MKDPQPLPCRLHPKDKVTVYKSTFSDDSWLVGCDCDSCMQEGASRHHAITRWNEAQKETK